MRDFHHSLFGVHDMAVSHSQSSSLLRFSVVLFLLPVLLYVRLTLAFHPSLSTFGCRRDSWGTSLGVM